MKNICTVRIRNPYFLEYSYSIFDKISVILWPLFCPWKRRGKNAILTLDGTNHIETNGMTIFCFHCANVHHICKVNFLYRPPIVLQVCMSVCTKMETDTNALVNVSLLNKKILNNVLITLNFEVCIISTFAISFSLSSSLCTMHWGAIQNKSHHS